MSFHLEEWYIKTYRLETYLTIYIIYTFLKTL